MGGAIFRYCCLLGILFQMGNVPNQAMLFKFIWIQLKRVAQLGNISQLGNKYRTKFPMVSPCTFKCWIQIFLKIWYLPYRFLCWYSFTFLFPKWEIVSKSGNWLFPKWKTKIEIWKSNSILHLQTYSQYIYKYACIKLIMDQQINFKIKRYILPTFERHNSPRSLIWFNTFDRWISRYYLDFISIFEFWA